MSNPLAFRIEHRTAHGLNRWLTDDASDVESARIAGCTVTPLIAAPPEDGRPTYAQLAEALRDARAMIGAARPDAWDSDIIEQGINEGDYQAARMRERLDAVIARIPKEEG